MTTPHDPQREGGGPADAGAPDAGRSGRPGWDDQSPRYDPYGPAGAAVPGQYGGGPYGKAQPGPPYGGDTGGYTYNPYGTPYPAGFVEPGVERVARPGVMIVSLVLLILASLPFLLAGVAALVVPLTTADIPAEVLQDPSLAAAGATPELLISAVRVFGGIFVVFSILFAGLAVLAFLGRNWARIVLTILSVGFAFLLLASIVLGGSAASGSIAVLVGVLVAVVAGVGILFMPEPHRFFTAPRG